MLLELFSGLFLLCACVFLCCWDRSRLKTHLEVVFQAHRLLHLNYILTLTPTLTQPSHTSLCILQLSTLTQCQIVLCDAGQSSVLLPVLLVRSPLVLDQPTLSAIVLFGRRFLCDKHLLLSINFLPGGSAFGFTVPPVPLGCCLFSSHGTNLKMDLKLCPSTMSCLCWLWSLAMTSSRFMYECINIDSDPYSDDYIWWSFPLCAVNFTLTFQDCTNVMLFYLVSDIPTWPSLVFLRPDRVLDAHLS